MSRVVKEHDVRETEIIHAAEKLFAERGYDETPVEAIISGVGIAKGTFYHYFRSKEDLLDAIIDHIVDHVKEGLDEVERKEGIDAVDRLMLMFEVFNSIGKGRERLVDFFHEERNVLLHFKIERRVIPLTVVLTETIIKEGIDQGLFKVDDPDIVAKGLMGAVTAVGEGHHDHAHRHVVDVRLVTGTLDMIERILGARSGLFMDHVRKSEVSK